ETGMVMSPMLALRIRAVRSADGIEQSGNVRERDLKPLEGPDVSLAGRRDLQAQHIGHLGVAQLFEMPQGDDLPVDRIHAIERRLDLDLNFRPRYRGAGRGVAAQQLGR